LGKIALIIGGSMAGLLAARVLSDHYEKVVILERDTLPEEPLPRKGLPQSYQPHLFLARGVAIIENLFPGIYNEMVAAGAVGHDQSLWRFVSLAGVIQIPKADQPLLGATRAFIEWGVRRHVATLQNVCFTTGVEVIKLVSSPDQRRVTGVQVRYRHAQSGPEVIAADLVVDASGRNSQAPLWLHALGYEAPPEESINAEIGYSSRLYRKPDNIPADWPNIIIQPRPPHNPRLGVVMAVEDNRWQVMLGGAAGHYPPTDEAGFLEWARSLPDPSLYQAIRIAEPVTPIRGFRIPTPRLRHFERLSRWPNGFIVTGDAVGAFNPLYAQGMTVAALEAEALARLLQATKPNWEQRFQRLAARIVADPWLIGAGEDLRWEGVQLNGKPANPAMRLIQRYMDLLLPVACAHPIVGAAFMQVVGMLASSTSLMRPAILLRVIWHTLRRGKLPAAPQCALSPATLAELQKQPEWSSLTCYEQQYPAVNMAET
jgi:2-polyprenyl-6-methoxyphenol hydroxylase-like FAD-dependent oxidoreductase